MELFIGNLSFATWETSLVSACGRFGEVIACRIARDKLGKHRGYGFVTFASETGAKACLSGLRELEGRDLKVEIVANDKQSLPTVARSTPPQTPALPTSATLQALWTDQQTQSAPAPTPTEAAFSIANHQVIVWNLSAGMTPQQLRQALSCFGHILDCVVCPLSPRIGNGAYGVVTFVDRLSATLAVSQSGVLEFEGKPITIQAVVPDPSDVAPATVPPSNTTGCTEIFVGNLSFETTLARLYATFAPYGIITDCRIPRFENGQPKGFGFVSYASRAAAETAIRNVSILDGRPLKLEIATGHKRSWVELQPTAAAGTTTNSAAAAATVQPTIPRQKPPSPTNLLSNGSFGSATGNTPPGTPSPLMPLEELLSALSLASLVTARPTRPTASLPVPRPIALQTPSHVSKALFQDLGELRGLSHEGGSYNPQDQCELFVGNLPFDATEAELSAIFSAYGLVTECRITVGLDGKPKGYGFVSFASAIDADVAARAMTELRGRTLNVQYAAAPRSGCGASAHAFVGWDRRSLMGLAL